MACEYGLLFIFVWNIALCEGLRLKVPAAGNCGDTSVLTCHETGTLTSWSWEKRGDDGSVSKVLINGAASDPGNAGKFEETKGLGSFSLIIKNTQISDAKQYRCKQWFMASSYKQLVFECKAKTASSHIGKDKKLTIAVDELFPNPSALLVTTLPQVSGSHTCSASSQYPSYQRCVWTSSQSWAAGSYSYSVTVTTVTQAAPITGTVRIVSPNQPIISGTDVISNSRVVVRGAEGQSTTLQCISQGGLPEPTVAWYRGSVSRGNMIASQSTGTKATDNTYTVTLNHQFTPTSQNDKQTYICKSYYPQASLGYQDSNTKTVILYLTLKPSQPVVSQNGPVNQGDDVTVTCTSNGSRPAPSVSWTFRGETTTGTDLATEDSATETITIQSTLVRSVSRPDNGQTVMCTVNNQPFSPLSGSATLNVRFPPTNASLAGNTVIVANGVNKLELSCTAGSSNPVSTISWVVSDVLSSEPSVEDLSGENGGTKRISRMSFTPRRNDDGAVITCSAMNMLTTVPVTDQVTLNLNYAPIINHIDDIQAVEGHTARLPCQSSSKPPSRFTWKRGSSTVEEGLGPEASNRLDYVIDDVDRTHTGSYTCMANNGIGPSDTKTTKLTVFYAPDVTITTSPDTYEENQTLQISCGAAGLPTNYSYGGFTQAWRGIIIHTYPAQSSVQLQSLRLEHSGMYKCTVSNGFSDRNGQMYQHNAKDVLVKVQPKIIGQHTFTGAPEKDLNITIPFYSYPQHSSLSIKQDGQINLQSSRMAWHVSSAAVPYVFHGTEVSLDGNNILLVIRNLTGDDFTNYTLEITNEVDRTSWIFTIISHTSPSGLSLVISPNKLTFTWIRGFGGGYKQYFIIEISAAGTDNWIQKLNISDGDDKHYIGNRSYTADIDTHLSPGSYKARIYAQNKIGPSSIANLETTFTIPADKEKGDLPLAAIAGGVGSAVLVLVVGVGIILIRRRYCQPEGNKEKQHTREMDIHLKEQVQDEHHYQNTESQNTESTTASSDGQANYESQPYASLQQSSMKPRLYEDLHVASIHNAAGSHVHEQSGGGNVYEQLDPKMRKDDDTAYSDVDFADGKDTRDEKTIYVNLEL